MWSAVTPANGEVGLLMATSHVNNWTQWAEGEFPACYSDGPFIVPGRLSKSGKNNQGCRGGKHQQQWVRCIALQVREGWKHRFRWENDKSMVILAVGKRWVNNTIIILDTITLVWLNAFPVHHIIYSVRMRIAMTYHLFSYLILGLHWGNKGWAAVHLR